MTDFVLELQRATLTGMPYGEKFKVKATGETWQLALLNYMEKHRGEAYICNGMIAVND